MGEYTRYLQALIDERRAHPREDLLSDLAHGANGHPGLPDDYTQCIVRGAARFDTTRDAITSTMLAVLQDPSIRDRVLADPVKMIPKATEKVLRRDAPHRGLFRITTRATELSGTPLPAGTPLLGDRPERSVPAAPPELGHHGVLPGGGPGHHPLEPHHRIDEFGIG